MDPKWDKMMANDNEKARRPPARIQIKNKHNECIVAVKKNLFGSGGRFRFVFGQQRFVGYYADILGAILLMAVPELLWLRKVSSFSINRPVFNPKC